MKKSILLVLIFLLFACGQHSNNKSRDLRIISLAPNITEILFALHLGDNVVAVTDYCDYPPAALKKEKIGGLVNPNLEKITALRPSLVVATESYRGLEEKITLPDARIIYLPEKTIDDFYISVDSIGVLTHKQIAADSLTNAVRDSLETYHLAVPAIRPLAVLVLGREAGGTRNISISGPGAFPDELWRWVGGRNAFDDLPVSFAQLNREDLLKRDPDLIIEFHVKDEKTDQSMLQKEWMDLSRLKAVSGGNIHTVNGSGFWVPGPRMYLLAKKFSSIRQRFLKRDNKK